MDFHALWIFREVFKVAPILHARSAPLGMIKIIKTLCMG